VSDTDVSLTLVPGSPSRATRDARLGDPFARLYRWFHPTPNPNAIDSPHPSLRRPRGPKKHLKRLNAPSHWMLDKLGGVFAPKPSPGPHKQRECLPLCLILRNRLKYALTYKEVTTILQQRLVKVDGKTRRDKCYPAGFMDVISIDKTDEHFRLIYDQKGRFVVHRITALESQVRRPANLSGFFLLARVSAGGAGGSGQIVEMERAGARARASDHRTIGAASPSTRSLPAASATRARGDPLAPSAPSRSLPSEAPEP
jgi:hypothetical protein